MKLIQFVLALALLVPPIPAPTPFHRVYLPVVLSQIDGMIYYMGEFKLLPLDPPISRLVPAERPTMPAP